MSDQPAPAPAAAEKEDGSPVYVRYVGQTRRVFMDSTLPPVEPGQVYQVLASIADQLVARGDFMLAEPDQPVLAPVGTEPKPAEPAPAATKSRSSRR